MIKHEYTEPFKSQFIRSLRGYAPWKAAMDDPSASFKQKAMAKKAPTEKQIRYLRDGLNYAGEIPASMAEVSSLIDKLKGAKI